MPLDTSSDTPSASPVTPWGSPAAPPPAPPPDPRRKISPLSILFFVLMLALVGGRAYRDLSTPEAWAYWKDSYLSPSLKGAAAEAALPGEAPRPVLAVSGRIGPAAAVWLRGQLDDARLQAGDTVVLSSPGGDVDQALLMGETIRARGLRTAVGTVDNDGRIRPSYCASACVLTYAGGTARIGLPGSVLGVHRFTTVTPAESRRDAVADTQRITGMILGYLTRMGVSSTIMEAMSASDDIRWLAPSQTAQMKLVTDPLPAR